MSDKQIVDIHHSLLANQELIPEDEDEDNGVPGISMEDWEKLSQTYSKAEEETVQALKYALLIQTRRAARRMREMDLLEAKKDQQQDGTATRVVQDEEDEADGQFVLNSDDLEEVMIYEQTHEKLTKEFYKMK